MKSTTTLHHHRPKLASPQDMRDVLPYQVSRLLSVAGAPVIRWCEGRFGISRRQWRLLAMLEVYGSLRSSELAELAELDRVRTSRALLEMQDRGLIVRQHEVANARYVRVEITPKGHDIYVGLWPLVHAHHMRLMSILTPDELILLGDILDRLQTKAVQLQATYSDLPKANRRAGGVRHKPL